MDKAIAYIQSVHPWITYAECFALVLDSFNRHKPEDKYSGMTKTLVDIDVRIFGRESRDQLMNRLSAIHEYASS